MTSGRPARVEFDFMAGAKAAYEKFYSWLKVEPGTPWERLTQKRQEQWVQVLKAGIHAAAHTAAQKEIDRSRRRIP